jgi:hypothetical protein
VEWSALEGEPERGREVVGIKAFEGGARALLGSFILAGMATPAAAADEGLADRLEGTWMADSYSDKLLAEDGSAPPLTAEAAQLYADRIAAHGDPDRQYDRTRWCAGPGMPRIMFMPYPFEIRADGDLVGFIYSWYRWHRVVDMSGRAADPILPQTMGYPVGRWDGGALVIETIGTTDETVLDEFGLPHSEDMVLTEKLDLLPDGKLRATYTIDDGAFYSRPWTAAMTYHRVPDVVVGDDVCPDRIAAGEPAVRSARP